MQMMSPAVAIADVANAEPHGVVGPNAVIQLIAALEAGPGPAATSRIFAAAGFVSLLDRTPTGMIDERIPARLFAALWCRLPDEVARSTARDAGRRTARYVLQNRIPAPVRFLLRQLPARTAARRLLRAIEKNAWTFAGSGACRTRAGNPALIEIAANPMPMPDCVWHQAVFEELFARLVTGGANVRHQECCRTGTPRLPLRSDLPGAIIGTQSDRATGAR